MVFRLKNVSFGPRKAIGYEFGADFVRPHPCKATGATVRPKSRNQPRQANRGTQGLLSAPRRTRFAPQRREPRKLHLCQGVQPNPVPPKPRDTALGLWAAETRRRRTKHRTGQHRAPCPLNGARSQVPKARMCLPVHRKTRIQAQRLRMPDSDCLQQYPNIPLSCCRCSPAYARQNPPGGEPPAALRLRLPHFQSVALPTDSEGSPPFTCLNSHPPGWGMKSRVSVSAPHAT